MVRPFSGARGCPSKLFLSTSEGDTLEDFLQGFPAVSRDLAIGVPEEAKQLWLARM